MKVGKALKNLYAEEREQNDPNFCLPRCWIGLEYEYENTNLFKKVTSGAVANDSYKMISTNLLAYFALKHDGSLRGDSTEFVLTGPMSGTKLYNAITAMDEASRAFGFTASYRTSLHVHLDMNTIDWPDDINAFALYYAIAEPFLFKFLGNNREACNYCVPWYHSSQHYELYLSGIVAKYGKKVEDSLKVSLQNLKAYKYSAMNFFSLGDFGTVELRAAPVNLQMAKTLQWINLIMRLKKAVLNKRYSKLDNIIESATTYGPEIFLGSVFGEDYPYLIQRSTNIKRDFDIGLKTAYHYISQIK